MTCKKYIADTVCDSLQECLDLLQTANRGFSKEDEDRLTWLKAKLNDCLRLASSLKDK